MAVAVASLSLVGLMPAVAVSTATAAEPAPAAPRNAVYRGAAVGSGPIAEYEAFVGRPMDYVLDFQATDTWSNQEWPSWQADAWRGRTVVLGATGIFPGDYHRQHEGGTVGWSQAASGAYDAHWRTLGERLVATGQAKAVLRGAHEFNGGWFPHRVHPEEVDSFVAAWRRWVMIMRAVPGQAFVFDWNPTLGQEWPLYAPELAYPGDAYVDHIALDVYDGWYGRGWLVGGTGDKAPPTAAERDAVWNTILNGPRGLTYWRDFSVLHGKKLSLPEWGVRTWTENTGLIHGGGDNASFVHRMAAIIKDPAWRVDYHAFWEDRGNGVFDADDSGRAVAVPTARAAYLAAFGSSSTVPPPAGCTGAPVAASAGQLPLMYSPYNDRSWGQELTGRTVQGDVYAWVPTGDHDRVEFTLDSRPTRTDTTAPFDLVGGHEWWAEPLNDLTAGTHAVKILAHRSDGTCLTRTATFTSGTSSAPGGTSGLARELGCTSVSSDVTTGALPLMYSPYNDRSWGQELTGKTVTGDVYAWVPVAGLSKVGFRLDTQAVRIDTGAPFDLVDGNQYWANPLRGLAAGAHSVEVVAQRTDGTCDQRTAGFSIG